MAARGRRMLSLIVIAFIVVPVAEIYVLIQVGQVIGAWWTIVLLVLDSLVGSWLIKTQGARAWLALRTALQSGRMPGRELADGVLILIGGTLMLSPGFVTDAFGILLILPLTRPFFRRMLTQVVTRRLLVLGPLPGGGFDRPGGRDGGPGPADGSGGPVVRGDVVDE